MERNDPPEPAVDTMVSNRMCTIERRGEDMLRCATRGMVDKKIVFALALVLIYGGIAMIVWHLPAARLDPATLLGGALALTLGLFIQWKGMRLQKEMGVYLIDRRARVVRKEKSNLVYIFDDVEAVHMAPGFSNATRLGKLPHIPFWLFIRFLDGRLIRIGRGEKEQLAPIIEWLEAGGLPASKRK